MDRREMLLEYFSLDISETGDVKTLPHLLREYTPNLDKLPMFLMRLGPQVCPNAKLPFTDTNLP
jgi:DNA mismatch repair protein MLH1